MNIQDRVMEWTSVRQGGGMRATKRPMGCENMSASVRVRQSVSKRERECANMCADVQIWVIRVQVCDYASVLV